MRHTVMSKKEFTKEEVLVALRALDPSIGSDATVRLRAHPRKGPPNRETFAEVTWNHPPGSTVKEPLP